MSQETIEYLPPQALGVAPQVRRELREEELAGLMQSIREVGVLQPIRARRVDGKLVIVDGHRRTAASIKLGSTAVPVIVEQAALDAAAVTQRQLIANIQRTDLTPLEKARGIAELMRSEKWTAAQAAAKLGLSAPTVSRLLALLELPEEIREQVASGRLPVSAAYELAKVEDPQRRESLAAQAVGGTLTRDALAGIRRSKTSAGPQTKEAKPVRTTAMLAKDRTVTVSAVGLTMETFIAQLEELLAKARRVRTQGLELPTFIKMLADQAKAGVSVS
jgi:ParB family chromosome partitioning protein